MARPIGAWWAVACVLAGGLAACGGDDEAVVVGDDTSPAWLQVGSLCLQSAHEVFGGGPPANPRAKAFAVQAMEAAGEDASLAAVAALAAAIAEGARGDQEAAARFLVAAVPDATFSEHLHQPVLGTAEWFADRVEIDAARALLVAWKTRVARMGLDRSAMALDIERALRDLDRPRVVARAAVTRTAQAAEAPAPAWDDRPPLGDSTELDFYPVDGD